MGERYYKPDEGYDKAVYENTTFNHFRIIGTLIFFWLFNGLHWWACFEFGVYNTELYTTYSIVVFSCSVLFGIGMLISGKISNTKKRQYEFLKEIIIERKGNLEAEAEAQRQKELYDQKI